MLLTPHWQVSCKGAAFEAYSAAIMSSGFGGDVIDMLDIDDVTQLMESMGIATNHKLVLKATFASWKKNPDAAFEALAAAKVARATHVRQLQGVIRLQAAAAANKAQEEAAAVQKKGGVTGCYFVI